MDHKIAIAALAFLLGLFAFTAGSQSEKSEKFQATTGVVLSLIIIIVMVWVA